MKKILLVLALAGFLVASDSQAETSSATSTSGSSWGYAIAHEIMSPFCPGRTLAACTSSQADELRQWILLQEAAGTSKEEVEAILYERFGDVVLAAPKPEGWGLGAYVIPIGAFALGAAAIPFLLRRMVGREQKTAAAKESGPAPASPAPLDDAALERLVDEELAAD